MVLFGVFYYRKMKKIQKMVIEMKLIDRKIYLDKLIKLLNTPDIKVITGVRRCGKSVLLRRLIDYLQETEPDANIIFITLQELEYDYLCDYHKLHEYVMRHQIEGVHNVVLIDEIQLCEKFELAINSLHAKQKFDIYLTGSNAFLLSSDLATLFTGRVMEVKVYPFSFSEYVDYFGVKENFYEAFDEYVRIGGMAGSYFYRTEEMRYEYINDVYKTILERDLITKYKVRNKAEFFSISKFAMDNIGNLFSSNSVSSVFQAHDSSITRKTVDKYMQYLENAFLFYPCKRYDLKGKKFLDNSNKYYLCDTSFRYAVNGTNNLDFGRMYENIVFIELLRRGYDVYVGKLYQKEIDFVATKRDEKIYIQVSDNILDKKTIEREVSPLLQIRDAYPKTIIARTGHENYYIEGILVTDLSTWLLS